MSHWGQALSFDSLTPLPVWLHFLSFLRFVFYQVWVAGPQLHIPAFSEPPRRSLLPCFPFRGRWYTASWRKPLLSDTTSCWVHDCSDERSHCGKTLAAAQESSVQPATFTEPVRWRRDSQLETALGEERSGRKTRAHPPPQFNLLPHFPLTRNWGWPLVWSLGHTPGLPGEEGSRDSEGGLERVQGTLVRLL